VLVVEDWHRATAPFKNTDNLLVDPPARQEPVPLEIGWIIPVFSDYHDTIHSKFLTSKSDGFINCLKDRDAFRFAYLLTQLACVKLMDVNRHHVHPRRSVGALPPIAVQKLGYDPVGM
jgi:hypothetical protein